MTTEQRAKAYDKALERAKIWQNHLYETNDKDYADELNYIFPELVESEGERIRKEIIEYIKTGTYHKSWIAWLEKQGEQNLANSAKTCKKPQRMTLEEAKEAFCKAICNGNPPRSTCTSLGTCKEYDNFVKFMKGE